MRHLFALAILLIMSQLTQGRTLVAYYSHTGNCRTIATEVKSQLNADMIEVVPSEKGIEYDVNNYAIGRELISAINNSPDDADCYPSIEDIDINLDNYQDIIVVTPLWWSRMAAPMQSFLFRHGSKMYGKNIGLVESSASSGISSVVTDCKRLIPDGEYIYDNLWIRSSQTNNVNEMVSEWIKENNMSNNLSDNMYIRVSDGTNSVIFVLNNTSASQSLYSMLPLDVDVSNYSNNEKIFYTPTDIRHGNDCVEGDCPKGTIALFSPWGNVVMYYGNASRYSGLYILGSTNDDTDIISRLNGTMHVEAVTDSTSIQSLTDNAIEDHRHFSANGMPLKENHNGIIITNGKKFIKK